MMGAIGRALIAIIFLLLIMLAVVEFVVNYTAFKTMMGIRDQIKDLENKSGVNASCSWGTCSLNYSQCFKNGIEINCSEVGK